MDLCFPAAQKKERPGNPLLYATAAGVSKRALGFAQLHKVYRSPMQNETRYSPAKCIGCSTNDRRREPRPEARTVRTTMRRYTRLSNGFSRKLENHAAESALNYFAYNFIKIHRTLRMSPAMAAGVTDRLWEVNDLVALWEGYEHRRAERAA
jgi:hypothetical protein